MGVLEVVSYAAGYRDCARRYFGDSPLGKLDGLPGQATVSYRKGWREARLRIDEVRGSMRLREARKALLHALALVGGR